MKKLLFVIESLTLGGAEKSLVTLLNLLDYEKYEVDLQLFSYGKEFEKLLPQEVNLLPILPFFSYCNIPYKNVSVKIRNIKHLSSQLLYSLRLRSGKYDNIEKSVLMWKSVRKSFKIMEKEYDVAIAYAQGVPTFYVADKIKASKKIAWINATYLPKEREKDYISQKYRKFQNINLVAEAGFEKFGETFPEHIGKRILIKDILDYEFNKKLAKLNTENLEIERDGNIIILTVGRLIESKGYDLAVAACKILKDKKIPIKWYIIGEGNKREELSEKIKELSLEEVFVLLGAKSNPYPYYDICDIYVQTSRYEGFCLTLSEARMFNKPVVTTEFNTVYSQIVRDKNGLVVDIDGKAIADGIEKMIKDTEYRQRIIENIKKEKKGNKEELEKFYEVIN